MQEAVVEADVPIFVFPSHGSSSLINDNYCVGPTHVNLSKTQLDLVVTQKTSLIVNSPVIDNIRPQKVVKPVLLPKTVIQTKTVNLDVSCHAVNLVYFANTTGQPQKKGRSPVHLLQGMKHVKGVSCVDPCRSAPLVHCVAKFLANLGKPGFKSKGGFHFK